MINEKSWIRRLRRTKQGGLILFLVLALLSPPIYAGDDDDSSPPAIASEVQYSRSNDPEYRKIITSLETNTSTPASEIERTLEQWIASHPMRESAHFPVQFLSHRYNSISPPMHPKWEIELNHLQIIAESAYFFDESGVYVRHMPQKICATPDERWRLSQSQPDIPCGAFKTVHKVTRLGEADSKIYALSIIPRDISLEEKSALLINYHLELYLTNLYEVSILKKIKELAKGNEIRGLLSAQEFGVSQKSGRIYFLSPFYNLGDALNHKLMEFLPTETLVQVADQVLSGLAFLHKNGIVHRDIKPSNILLRGNFPTIDAALIDFGTAYDRNQIGLEETLSKEDFIKTTHRYLAPEAIEKFHLRSSRRNLKRLREKWETLKETYELSDDPKVREAFALRWNPSWSDFETDQISDDWAMGVSLMEMASAFRATAFAWAPLTKKSNLAPLKIGPEHFLWVKQDQVDRVLDILKTNWAQDDPLSRLHPVLVCLLQVRPEDRCTAERALEILRTGTVAAR